MKQIVCLLCLVGVISAAHPSHNPVADNDCTKEQQALAQWRAGVKVSEEAVRQFGIENCFVAEEISDGVFKRMYGKSYKTDCNVKRSDLRYLRVLHYDAEGNLLTGELVCHRTVSGDLLSIFRALYDAKYPIERMVLIDEYGADDDASMRANNTSCFNYRTVAGSKKRSNHSLGCAVDINPLYNPYVKRRTNGSLLVKPATARKYADRSKDYKYKIKKGDLCYRLFIKYGFKWGGNWKSLKDYQHFEKVL